MRPPNPSAALLYIRMLNDNFYEAAKFAGIALTALLGAIGVLGDFRTSDKKSISALGYLMIVGVVMSGALTIAATAHDDRAQGRRTNQIVTNTQKTVDKTNAAVLDIRNILSQIVDPQFHVSFQIDCARSMGFVICMHANELLHKYLSQERKHPGSSPPGVYVDDDDGQKTLGILPETIASTPAFRFFENGYIQILLYRRGAQLGGTSRADARYAFNLDDTLVTRALDVAYSVKNGKRTLEYRMERVRPSVSRVYASALSFEEARGGTMLIFAEEGFKPEVVVLQALNGQTLSVDNFVLVDHEQGRDTYKGLIPYSRQ